MRVGATLMTVAVTVALIVACSPGGNCDHFTELDSATCKCATADRPCDFETDGCTSSYCFAGQRMSGDSCPPGWVLAPQSECPDGFRIGGDLATQYWYEWCCPREPRPPPGFADGGYTPSDSGGD